ncbi:MAG: hypothetical protein VB082_03285 [Christensenella sp.]|nr:hypothetical protein [Christensenella sp.]
MQLFGLITIGSTVAIFVVCLILYCRIQKKRHFLCPHCGMRFKVPGMRSFFATRQGTDRLLTCPRCGMNLYMENVHDEDYERELAESPDLREDEDYEDNWDFEDEDFPVQEDEEGKDE